MSSIKVEESLQLSAPAPSVHAPALKLTTVAPPVGTLSPASTPSSTIPKALQSKTSGAVHLPPHLVTPTPVLSMAGVPNPTVATTSSLSAIAKRSSNAPPALAHSVPATVPATGRQSNKSKKKKAQPVVTMATAATAQSNGQGSQGENTGRWTAEEHRLFLQGLELHGKGWKKIASLIKSRTVVQIRTHAQKYFQKLAKARQNGEEGEVAMEGRGGTTSVASVSTTNAAQTSKRRRQTTGTKRKAIQSVVSSAQRQSKKMAFAAANGGQTLPTPIPTASPALAHFLLPSVNPSNNSSIVNTNNASTQSCVPSITTAQGTISGPALEDSLFRFLTPAPVMPEAQLNEVARQAGANPITLPSECPSSAPSSFGETSPTGVADLAVYPSWTDAKDIPTWYSRGADVDALLDVGDTLDWLTDTGDLHEAYQPPPTESIPLSMEDVERHEVNLSSSATSTSVTSLPCVETSVESVVPPLPSLFEGTTEAMGSTSKELEMSASAPPLHRTASADSIDEHLQVFDTPMEEHDFVSTILENTNENIESLPVLA